MSSFPLRATLFLAASCLASVPAWGDEPAPPVANTNPPPAMVQEDSNPPPSLSDDTPVAPAAPASPVTAPAPLDVAPPPVGDAAPADTAPPSMDDANAPPAMDDPNVPAAQVGAAGARSLMARFTGLELGISAGSLLAGWALSTVVMGVTGFAFSSLVLGHLALDLPLVLLNMLQNPMDTTAGAKALSGTNGGIMAGGLILGVLSAAVLSGFVAYGLSAFSVDWEAVLGTAVAGGLLAGAAVLGVFGTAFIVSLFIPVPLVWLGALVVAGVVGTLVPPVAMTVGLVFGKRARPAPGGLLAQWLSMIPTGPFNRPPQAGQ